MKHIVLISIILLSLLCFGCGEENRNNDPLQSLEGTQWKLVGIVDSSGSLKELEPKDCKECYTLVWSADDKVTAHVMNRKTLMLDMLNLTPGYIPARIWPELFPIYGEYYDDCMWFCSCLVGTESYDKTVNELKLYYLNTKKNSYILFKSI